MPFIAVSLNVFHPITVLFSLYVLCSTLISGVVYCIYLHLCYSMCLVNTDCVDYYIDDV